jgi:hypothetical protein
MECWDGPDISPNLPVKTKAQEAAPLRIHVLSLSAINQPAIKGAYEQDCATDAVLRTKKRVEKP